MKNLILILFCAVTLCSCYNTRILVGNVQPNDPMVEVNSIWEHHWIGGLVSTNSAKIKADDYVKGRQNYMVLTNQTFVNGLVGFITFGIYTPTQTTFFVPLKDAQN